MLLQAALNGDHAKAVHPAVPVTPDELVRDAVACVAAGAGGVHLHPRGGDGRERLEAEVVDAVAARVRAACGVPVGVSTGAWIEPDARRRAALVRRWTAPDHASVNVAEEGFEHVMRALLDAGVGIEAGVWSAADAGRLAASGLAGRVLRVLIEPGDRPAGEALRRAAKIHAALDAGGVTAPRLQHGDGASAWSVLEDALRRGADTRIGLEDTTRLPDGRLAAGNAELVAAARALGAGVA